VPITCIIFYDHLFDIHKHLYVSLGPSWSLFALRFGMFQKQSDASITSLFFILLFLTLSQSVLLNGLNYTVGGKVYRLDSMDALSTENQVSLNLQ
jgi:hypothetical protein